MRQRHAPRRRSGLLSLPLAALAALAACAPVPPAAAPVPAPVPAAATAAEAAPSMTVVPMPASVRLTGGAPFTLTPATRLEVPTAPAAARDVAEYFARILRPSTGFPVPVSVTAGAASPGGIRLDLGGGAELGEEGYRLEVTEAGVTLTAHAPAGLFHGVQTMRQLLPPAVDAQVSEAKPAWTIPAGTIVDRPRFAWRGSMLDVARHFFTVDEVKQYVDALALYKLNVLHLHLSDDQGWRIEIRSRPQLTRMGGGSQVGGGQGGYYTQAEYAEIVRYAAERFVTIVPEIDTPAHTNAALVAFPALSCGKRPPEVYTGTEVGFSALCVENEETYRLVDDVVREIAALTPGAYFHVGGDEVQALTDEQYAHFIERVQEIVTRHGKRMVGWEEISKARLLPTTLSQQWKSDSAAAALRQGVKLVLSPAKRAYIDMKYDRGTPLGLSWAALVELRDAYDWDPATAVPGAGESDVAGVEAPLWSETIQNLTAAYYLAFPRLPALAEVAWSPAAAKDWESFRARIAAHAPRWTLLGINYYPSPQVPWRR